MSVRRMSLGAGYRYLMSSVARGDGDGRGVSALTRYYAESGTPPGRFAGAGLAGLADGVGVEPGSVVGEAALQRMLGCLQDPVTGRYLGRPPLLRSPYVDADGVAHAAPKPVAGFDLTFSVPKSVSVAWALADVPTRDAVYGAHRAAVEHVLRFAEEQVFCSRTGKAGATQVDVRGVVAAVFDHWDSRAGDPQLHSHVVVLNRAQGVDGKWRTLDSRAVFRSTVALSELYNGVLSDYLTAALGWGWEPVARRHSTVPKYEVTGVPAMLREEFSQRSTAIEDAKNALFDRFALDHGREPTAREVLKLRQTATLATRPGKQVRPLVELVDGWRDRADSFLDGVDPGEWAAGLAGRNDLPLLRAGDLDPGMLDDLAAVTLATVGSRRATFTRANLLAEAARQLHGARFATPEGRVAVVAHVTDSAADRAVVLTFDATPDPGMGARRDRLRDPAVYATVEVLDAETRLLDASRSLDGPAVHPMVAEQALPADVPGEGHPLSGDQRDAVRAVVTSPRSVDVLVGAAGTGKTAAMRGVRAAWEAQFGPGSVVGLAPSAAAADVLADAVGIPTENTSKWLTAASAAPDRVAELERIRQALWRAGPSRETRALRDRARVLAAELHRSTLSPGRLVIVDEASMAATADLDTITTHARQAGAKVLLVGDWAQLSPVGAGGAFRLLATDRDDTPTLHDVRRFRHEWERTASTQLRAGDPTAIDTYISRGRVEGGDRESMLDLLHDAWATDIRAGRTSIMVASDAQTVTDLNDRARATRVRKGEVHPGGVHLASGSVAGVGDLVVTRRNHRGLTTGAAWVKNGDQWTVTAIRPDGSLDATRTDGRGRATLPAGYVARHVDLGYATTAHRAQGRTVETAHAYVTATTLREPLYVMATRGREANRLYVDTTYDPDAATSHTDHDHRTPADVLRSALAATGDGRSALLTLAAANTPRHGLRPTGAPRTLPRPEPPRRAPEHARAAEATGATDPRSVTDAPGPRRRGFCPARGGVTLFPEPPGRS